MNNITTLNELKLGDTAIVQSLNCSGTLKRRFLDLGIIKGTEISAILKSPFNNPVAYDIKNNLIALRNEDAEKILIKIL